MMCPKCGADSNVLETRTGSNHTVLRRHQCKRVVKHKFTTVEVYMESYCSAKQRSEQFAKTTNRRVALFERDLEIYGSWALGVPALMAKFGVSKSQLFLSRNRIIRDLQIKLPRALQRAQVTAPYAGTTQR